MEKDRESEIDYETMYQIMMKATEKALTILIEAQLKCEDLYIRAGEKGRIIELGLWSDKDKE